MTIQPFQLTDGSTQLGVNTPVNETHQTQLLTTGEQHARTYHKVSNRKLRVLMVTPRYFPYMGGVENHVYQVARRLAHAGTDVTVLTTDPSRELQAAEEVAGVKIRRVVAWPAERDYYFAPQISNVI
ncbi:MAG TPA: glycosyltransferase, partial [Caldilineaceae bacterium]|nr:glycosyltransferase [Caldilineaceae bacterium]